MLLAQQTALAHDFWHSAQAQKAARGDKLCDLHDLLGTVLGAVSAAVPHTNLLSFCDIAFSPVAGSAAQPRALVPQSRGPPALT